MIDLFKRLSWFFKREKYTYISLFFLLLLLVVLSILPAQIIGFSIDLIIGSKLNQRNFLIICIVIIAIPIIKFIVDWSYAYLINKKGQELVLDLRNMYFSKIFSMDSKLFETYTKGDLVSRVTQDIDYIKMGATNILQDICSSLMNIILIIFIMCVTISFKLTIVAVTIIPIGLIILSQILVHKRKYYKIHRKKYSNMAEGILESVEGSRVVRAYVQEENDTKKMHDAIQNDNDSWWYIIKFEAIFSPMFDLLYAISYFLTFSYGTYLIINMQLTAGQLITFSMLLVMLNGPILSLGLIFSQINQVITAKERIYEILDAKSDVVNVNKPLEVVKFNNIEYKNVVFKYPFDEDSVIKNISFDIPKGKTIGIVGPTGSGKSTVVRQLLREFNITKGHIYIDGKDIEEFNIQDVRNLVGYVPQSHILFKGDVENNLRVGNPEAKQDTIQKAIHIADFEKDLSNLSDGLMTEVGENAQGLSGGQKQRLSIARAVIGEPEILILDDSLSAVDANTEKNIISHLREYRKDKTNIIIAHRFSAIKEADIILVFNDGKIVNRGTHDQLMKQKDWYYKQYLYQTQGIKESND